VSISITSRRIIFSGIALSQLLLGGQLRAEQSNLVVIPDPGKGAFVLAYGNEILAPFRFTGIGSDTLKLNGIAYYPTAAATDENNDPVRSDQDRVIPKELDSWVSELDSVKDATVAEGKRLRGPLTGEQKAELVAGRIQSLPFVHEANASGKAMQVLFQGVPTPYTILFSDDKFDEEQKRLEEHLPPLTTKQIHDKLIAEFAQNVEAGNFIAIGAGYNLTGNSGWANRTRQSIEKLSKGASLSSVPINMTALCHEAFLKDVLGQLKK